MQENTSLLIAQGGELKGSAHPSSVLAIEWMSEKLPPVTAESAALLDYGCGSGVLSLVAAHLSPMRIVACDREAEAVAAARRIAEANGLGGRLSVLRAQSPTERQIRQRGPYRVIVANILAEMLLPMLSGFKSILSPDGEILLSGILRWQEAGFADACRAAGFRIVWRRQEGDWVAMGLTA